MNQISRKLYILDAVDWYLCTSEWITVQMYWRTNIWNVRYKFTFRLISLGPANLQHVCAGSVYLFETEVNRTDTFGLEFLWNGYCAGEKYIIHVSFNYWPLTCLIIDYIFFMGEFHLMIYIYTSAFYIRIGCFPAPSFVQIFLLYTYLLVFILGFLNLSSILNSLEWKSAFNYRDFVIYFEDYIYI